MLLNYIRNQNSTPSNAYPIKKLALAAMAPTNSVSKPDQYHFSYENIDFATPSTNKKNPVKAIEVSNRLSSNYAIIPTM